MKTCYNQQSGIVFMVQRCVKQQNRVKDVSVKPLQVQLLPVPALLVSADQCLR